MTLEKALQILINDQDDVRAERFLQFLSDKLWGQYNSYVMDKLKMVDSTVKWNLCIPNAKENEYYDQKVMMPELDSQKFPGINLILTGVAGLDPERHGVTLTVASDGRSFAVTGTPSLNAFRKDGAMAESTFELTLTYKYDGIELGDCPSLTRTVPFVINQDPRMLWRNIAVDWGNMPEPKYVSPDEDSQYVKVDAMPDGTLRKDIVAASKRGRSHAQEGKPRDDNFKVEFLDNGWYVMAVADGAGSAKYSRKGSQIACEESVNYCKVMLSQAKAFEEAIETYYSASEASERELQTKRVGDMIYNIVGVAAHKAYKEIVSESTQRKIPTRQYATTLLLTISKRFSFGWFVASFWVGDGAICLYNREKHTAKILGVPDEGEFAGQTRFLTMPEIFADASSLYKRLRFQVVDDFTALFMMTDGVSDPKFETDANLINPDKWDALWDDLRDNGVELTDDNKESKYQLLRWLDFWVPGNHDDRTIAILYEGEPMAEVVPEKFDEHKAE